MAVGRLPARAVGLLRCILYSIVDRRSAFLVALSFYCLLSVAGIAADVQVNAPDHNVPDQGNITTEAETYVAVSGSLVVVGYNTTKQGAFLGSAVNSRSGFAYSTNGGATFTDGGFVPANGNKLGGDPALAFSADGTTLYYASIGTDAGNVSRIFVTPSTSLSPVTFGTSVAIPGVTSGAKQDKEFIAVDTTQGPNRGRVYVAWSEFPDPNSLPDGKSSILFAASSSTTPLQFSTPKPISPLSPPPTVNNHGAMPAVAPNGDVYVVWSVFIGTDEAPQTIQIVRSMDGGVSFQNPDPADPYPSKTIASVTSTVGRMCDKTDTTGTIPKCPKDLNIRTRGFAYIAIDQTPPSSPTRGNIYVVFQAKPPAPATGRSQIFFTRSTDGGKTWGAPRSISNGPAVTINADPTQNDNWMPSIAVSPMSGHIRVVFYSRREDPQNIDIRVYDAGSTDAGLTWFNQPRSTKAFRPSTGYDPTFLFSPTGQAFMGDYISVVASGSNFYAAWGDTRNQCTPPPGAPKPCSPAGRGDQDVFFSTDTDPTGADLAITPWGNVTGQGPAWQSLDVFVVDNANNVINAKQGIVNGLRARIRNLGNAAATGATVRFAYAPYSVGLTASGFKEIAAPTVNFAAAGDTSGNDLIVVPAPWDLTNPAEDNGGIWPAPISSFEHFCVRVGAELPADINQSNNAAQSNFVDVTKDCCHRPLRFLIGNPLERAIRARLVIGPLPKGYSVTLDAGGEDRNALSLKPKEIRVATAQFVRPAEFAKERRTSDVVASISMQVDNQQIGGLSVRLAEANAPAQPAPAPRQPRRTPRSR
jgi:hypothetical protein